MARQPNHRRGVAARRPAPAAAPRLERHDTTVQGELAGVTDDALPQSSPAPEESPGRRDALAWPSPEVTEPGD
jgi:hypothetical protein